MSLHALRRRALKDRASRLARPILVNVIATTVGLDHDIDLVKLGARSGLLWRDTRTTLAGVGRASSIPVQRPLGAAAAQAVLGDLAGLDDVGCAGSGPVGFAAFPFDRTAPGSLVVPEIVLGQSEAGQRWLTLVQDGQATNSDIEAALARVQAVMDRQVPAGPDATTMTLRSALAPSVWRDIVGEAVSRISAGELNKAVLAREIVLETDEAIDPAAIIDHLRQTFATAILFNVDGFLGASPELLAARTNDVVWAHPLAGTAPRGADPATDAALAANLLASTKNQWEHRITIGWLLNTLLPFCSYVDAEPEPSIVTLSNVHHLGTKVEGKLSSPPVSILELVAALHPTPAVGGDPQDKSLQLIAEIERSERDLYAGPVGWVDGSGNGAFAVGIRSATIDEGSEDNQSGPHRVRIFSGVGVVADSDPQAELDETRSKLQAMLGAFIRP